MKFSTRLRYGTRALLDIALQSKEPVLLKDVAQRQVISLAYLEHIITPLVAAGILRSTRGPKGGVWLAKDPLEVRMSEVVQILEGTTAPAECVENPSSCSRSELCAARDLWDELKKAMDETLESMTLQDLVERQRGKEKSDSIMYYV